MIHILPKDRLCRDAAHIMHCTESQEQGVQRRIVLVVFFFFDFFFFFSNYFFFPLLFPIFDLVHDAEAIFPLP